MARRDEPPAPLRPGRLVRVGNYVVERPLGVDGQADVFLARDVVLRRLVALKLLHPSGDDKANLRAVEEARVIATLDHPNIVRVHHVELVDGMWAMAMEYVDGGSLETRVERLGPMPLDRVLRHVVAIADALGHAHKLGVVHRDVKPQNLLMTRSGVVKLADFGLAAMRTDLGRARAVGTPQFVAPEVWQGRAASPASDIYALGATLVYLLGGRPPFPDLTSIPQLREAHLHGRPTLPPKMPSSVTALLERCLAKAPQDRFATALEVGEAAGEALARLGARIPHRAHTEPTLSFARSRELEEALAALPPFSEARAGLESALAGGVPVIVMAGSRGDLRARVARAVLDGLGARFYLAARCQLVTNDVSLATVLNRQLRGEVAPGPGWIDRALAELQPEGAGAAPTVIELELARPLAQTESQDLMHLARRAEGKGVLFVVSADLAVAEHMVMEFEGSGLGYLAQVVRIGEQTAAHVRKHIDVWLALRDESHLRWTADALALITHLALTEQKSLDRLLNNAIAVALGVRMPMVTSWCVLAADAHPQLVEVPSDIMESWRARPRTWPSAEALSRLRQARSRPPTAKSLRR